MQIEDPQATESTGDDGEVGIGDARIERTRNGLREVQFDQAREPIGHSAEHVWTRTRRELLPFGALQSEPPLAHQPEDLLVLLALKLRQDPTKLVVGKSVVYAELGARSSTRVDRVRSHCWCRGKH